ncbi:terminase small subunit [Avibacterium paragallinarum]|nr:terminase small subunit [Avibacterium paragallinarum]UXN38139.1 terminase small subunit [Avibacterium paragallinarum]
MNSPRGKAMTEKLTPKQEKFCQLYLELGNASEAYRQAYNAEKMKPETINTKASELLHNGKIAERVSELRQLHQERHCLTVDKIIFDLQDYLAVCTGKKPIITTTVIKNAQEGTAYAVNVEAFIFEPTGANKAFELLGKHLGMFSQKVDLTSSDGAIKLGSLRDLFLDGTEEGKQE